MLNGIKLIIGIGLVGALFFSNKDDDEGETSNESKTNNSDNENNLHKEESEIIVQSKLEQDQNIKDEIIRLAMSELGKRSAKKRWG